MSTSGVHRAGTSTAAYLRCYPHDPWRMPAHRDLLNREAARLGFPEPVVFLDNGCSSTGAHPQLAFLLELAASEVFEVVLIPGAWVFSLDDVEAGRIHRELTGYGCRILESSAHGLPARARSASGLPLPELRSGLARTA